MSALALIALLTLSPVQQVAVLAPAAAADTPGRAGAPNPLVAEPQFADLVARATGLKDRVAAYRTGLNDAGTLTGLDAFKTDLVALSTLDQGGSDVIRARGNDGDLACILQGISLDLRYRMGELEKAEGKSARDAALKEMFYLLRDNVEVITAPPLPTV